ncbi:MAG: ATP-binding protein [Solirubrobacterales bacterium]|nr:ATP-binding protein [Solirubrobacterales bacterium]
MNERALRLEVASDADIVPARARGRALAAELGFSRTDATLVATAISEIARNIVVHAGRGEIELTPAYEPDRRGVVVIARDQGPGIRDVDAALTEGHGTKGGLGLGLPGARRIMDEFVIDTAPNQGTTVTMHMWRDVHELDGSRR